MLVFSFLYYVVNCYRTSYKLVSIPQLLLSFLHENVGFQANKTNVNIVITTIKL